MKGELGWIRVVVTTSLVVTAACKDDADEGASSSGGSSSSSTSSSSGGSSGASGSSGSSPCPTVGSKLCPNDPPFTQLLVDACNRCKTEYGAHLTCIGGTVPCNAEGKNTAPRDKCLTEFKAYSGCFYDAGAK